MRDRHGRSSVGRAWLAGVVALALLATSMGAVAGSSGTGAGTATQAQASVGGGTDVAGAAGSCSFRETDTRVAYEGSTAGVLDPDTDDDLAVLLGGFTDTSPNYTAGQFERAFFGTGPSNAAGPGTLRDYYLEATDGEIALNGGPAGVNGWYETDMSSDQIIDDSPPGDANSRFVRKVIEQADSDVDFKDYDNDNDGCIAIVVVYQGAEIRAFASSPWGNFFKDADFNVDVDGVTVSAYARVAEEHANSNGQTGNRETIGTPAHEIGHLYGLPDLYEEGGGDDIGLWGLMARGNFGNQSGALSGSSPTHPSAWSKLRLLQSASPEIDTLDEYRVTIPRSDRPGILPPAATHNEFYRIEPRDVSGCSACDGQYYLLAYRKLVGFDAGLSRIVGNTDSLRISRINGPWDEDLNNDPDLIDGTNRLDGFGNQTFNATTSDLATLADGSASGIELENFSEQYGMATFNDPPQRHLDPDETAVYAIAVGQTLPDGTVTDDQWTVDHRVATKASSANVSLELRSTRDTIRSDSGETASARGQGFVRVSTADRLEGVKVIQTTDTSTDYISATTYPTYELPSAMTMSVTEPWQDFASEEPTVSVELNVSAAGDTYEYGEWDAPDESHFGVTIGGVEVPTEDLTVTEHAEHRYEVEAVVPDDQMADYGLNVSFTGEKAGITHTIRADGNILTPVLREMAGSGVDGDPYQVTTMPELQAIDAAPDSHYQLTSDIDASATENWFGGDGFLPIGDTGEYPQGVNVTLDGNGHTISGLTIDRPDRRSMGLFGAIDTEGTVENLRLENPTVRGNGSSGGSVGTLAAYNRGTVENVTVTGATVSEESDFAGDAGGLVGFNGLTFRDDAFVGGTIQDSSVTGTVSADGSVGGIAATNRDASVIDSHSGARVRGGRQAGGLVGENDGQVRQSAATGDVSGDREVGGLVGLSNSGISESYATGNVSGDERTGGLVGRLRTGNSDPVSTVSESFATGDVDGTREVGGLVGVNDFGNVSESYARGDVNGTGPVSGLVGSNNQGYDGGFVVDSYATGEVTGEGVTYGLTYNFDGTVVDSYWSSASGADEVDTSDNGQVLEPEEMRGAAARDNMAGFDFENTWTTVDGEPPQLQWYAAQQQTDADTATASDTGDADSDDSDSSDEESDDETESEGSSGESGPGMGIPAAVLGLAVASLLFARRKRES